VSERKPYPSDVSDERWALIEPVITAWNAAHPSVSGHQGGYAMREIVNAILYQGRTGCQWDFLPHDLPPRSAVYYYFAKWRDDGTDQTIHDLLRWHTREKRGRLADPRYSTRRVCTRRPGCRRTRPARTRASGCPGASAAQDHLGAAPASPKRGGSSTPSREDPTVIKTSSVIRRTARETRLRKPNEGFLAAGIHRRRRSDPPGVRPLSSAWVNR
jgi:transposase